MRCSCCGLDHRSVKLTQMGVSATIETHTGAKGGGSITVCEFCKDMLLNGNHPLNKKRVQESGGADQQGYIKKSSEEDQGDRGGYPPVRE